MPYSKTTSALSSSATNLVVGFMGEVGQALYDIFYEANPETVAGIDRNPQTKSQDSAGLRQAKSFDILHICIPFNPSFIKTVKDYQHEFKPKVTIIHSTVPVGTSRALSAIHSPIRGLHPNLKEGIFTFPKFLAGQQASLVADIFRRAGLKVILFDRPETSELAKISETTFYALQIEYIKDLKRQCDKLGLSFAEVYTENAREYNEGYKKLGRPEFCMPLLQPILTKQGGHCTINNCNLWNTEFTKLIKKLNEKN